LSVILSSAWRIACNPLLVVGWHSIDTLLTVTYWILLSHQKWFCVHSSSCCLSKNHLNINTIYHFSNKYLLLLQNFHFSSKYNVFFFFFFFLLLMMKTWLIKCNYSALIFFCPLYTVYFFQNCVYFFLRSVFGRKLILNNLNVLWKFLVDFLVKTVNNFWKDMRGTTQKRIINFFFLGKKAFFSFFLVLIVICDWNNVEHFGKKNCFL
jgi:hypothetical protein